MELPLVVGVDGSESSLRAVDWATDEAARHGVPLRLVHASLWERYEGASPSFGADRPAERVMAEHVIALSTERAKARNPQVEVSGEIVPEEPVTALLRAGHQASALVTGSRGRGGLTGQLLGSVSLSAAARAVCPVIVVRGSEQNLHGAYRRVVLGVGDTPEVSAAARFAFEEAAVRHCALHVVRGWRRTTRGGQDMAAGGHRNARSHEEEASHILSDALRAGETGHQDVKVVRQVIEGHPHQILLEASTSADLLVVGALRGHGRIGLQLGRVNHALLHHSRCPVAVVPQRA